MSAERERPRLREDVNAIGLAGVALLRLHASRDPAPARACIEELRELLARIDDDSALDTSTPLLDVVTGYDRWAAVYDAPGNPLVACEEHAVQSMLDRFDGDPVLDAACGTGRHLAYLAARGHQVIGTDLSPQMVEKAREKVPSADLRVGDLLSLPVDDGEMSAVVCALALDHVADLHRAYAELARVTASAGAVVISTMHPVLQSVFGWGAWFVDGEGKTDVVTVEHALADHLNAASAAGLRLRHCEEPTSPTSLLPPDTPPTVRIAYEGLPMVLVLEFAR